jgi:glycine dehydrogenase subunit 2
MKYNPKINEKMAALPGLAGAHPLLPARLSQGALRLMYELERMLAEITGMEAVSVQPAAGAQGELAGMLIIHAWHASHGNPRSKIIVPDTAHGHQPGQRGALRVPAPSRWRPTNRACFLRKPWPRSWMKTRPAS